MKNLIKNKIIKRLVAAVIILLAALFVVISIFKSISAYAYSTADAAVKTNSIDNIYDETQGRFLEENLNALAQKGGFDDLKAMISAAESGETKTSADFGHSTVKFGKSFGGDGAGADDLVWIPVYLSNSTQGPVLTLWLASSDHVSRFNEQFNVNAETKPSSNNYSTSKIRVEVLNNSGVYYSNYGNNGVLAQLEVHNYSAVTTNAHRYQMYTTGVLKDYIVEPAAVSWQTGEGSNRLKNDPGWAGNDNGYYFQDNDGNYVTWVNDKLWLPSLYETVDGSVPVNCTEIYFDVKNTSGVADINAAGLWSTNSNERACYNNGGSLLRSTQAPYYADSYVATAGGYNSNSLVNYEWCVRPALHLNLEAALNGTVPPHVHEWESAENDGWVVTTPATCTGTGLKERVCTASGCSLEDGKETQPIEIDSTAHSFATTWESDETNHWHAATCSHKNEKDGYAAHLFPNEWVVDKEATEEAAGIKHRDCTVCGYRQTETISTLPHTHKFNNWIAEDPASCTKEGAKAHYLCTCGKCFDESHEEITNLTIPKTAHEWGSWTNNGNASTHTRGCNNCTETQTEQHIFPDDWVTDREATEEAAGSKHRDCTACAYAQTETIPQLNHTHKYGGLIAEVPASCTASGTKAHYTCGGCGLHFDEEYQQISDLTVAATGHNWNGGEITTPATCMEEGVKTYTCTACGETRTESVSAKGHTEVTDEAKAPACTETGLTEGKHCSECNAILTAQDEIPANGHSYEWQITKKPTNDETGLKKNICTVCGNIDGEEVIAKLVSDENGKGDVIDLEPDKEYDLEILVKPTNALYAVGGVNVGYEVALWIIVDGQRDKEYDSSKAVTLMLRVPDEMADKEFELYKVNGVKLVPVEKYEVEGNVVTLRTTLSAEIVFHAEAEPAKGGVPVWVWAIVAAVIAVLIIIIVIILIKKKGNGNNGGTHVSVAPIAPAPAPVTPVAPAVPPVVHTAPAPAPVIIKGGTQYNDAELKARLAAQDKKLDRLLARDDGGFGATVQLDEHGNIIK